MTSRKPVPKRPLLFYDGDCGFCRRWIARWRARTGKAVDYVPFQRTFVRRRWRVTRAAARQSVQLLEPSGRRSSGAEAVARVLGRAPRLALVSRLMRAPGVRTAAALIYHLIARHRSAAGRIDRLLFGMATTPPSRRAIRWLFVRALGVVYLVAFSSLRPQLLGLFGQRGIRPISPYLQTLRDRFGTAAPRLVPSLFWLDASDRTLVRACEAGQLGALLVTLGIAPRALLAALWALYLSFVSTGREFLSYQWDVLLLETGLDATLIGPGGIGRQEPPRAGAALLRWLAFRLPFESGLAKLQSRDPTWRSFRACSYHYMTQPLPTPLGWYAHHLPMSIQRLSTAVALGVELCVPFFGFGPRRVRLAGFSALTGLQLLIAATGNYGFFNLLSVVLGLWFLDDQQVNRGRHDRARPTPLWRRLANAALALPLGAVSVFQLLERFGKAAPRPVERLRERLAPLRSVNSYGLFSVMTTTRPEIVVEGSDDGQTWREYQFRYKPGDPRRPPRWVAPHQPRLDWQMWFAAMGPPPAWFASFMVRLLEGSPEVLGLLAANPFPDRPPRFVRALLYDYSPSDLRTRRETGLVWHRVPLGTYFPTVGLKATTVH